MNAKLISPEDYLRVQGLLFEEAAMIDSWQLSEWLNLYTEDGEYMVPSTDTSLSEDATPENSLYYIADDRARMEERVIRLKKKTCHSEWPRSKVRHLVANLRVLDNEGGVMTVEASFVCYRSKDDVTDTFMGRYEYTLVDKDGELKIRKKVCRLDLTALRPHGRISIIL